MYKDAVSSFLASPCNYIASDVCILYSAGTIYHDDYYDSYGLRPVVCLPASAIEVVGEGENIALNYK